MINVAKAMRDLTKEDWNAINEVRALVCDNMAGDADFYAVGKHVGATETQRKLDVAVAALRELVALKDIKEESDYNLLYSQTTGNFEKGKALELEYRSRKQDAWRAAHDALRQIGALSPAAAPDRLPE